MGKWIIECINEWVNVNAINEFKWIGGRMNDWTPKWVNEWIGGWILKGINKCLIRWMLYFMNPEAACVQDVQPWHLKSIPEKYL